MDNIYGILYLEALLTCLIWIIDLRWSRKSLNVYTNRLKASPGEEPTSLCEEGTWNLTRFLTPVFCAPFASGLEEFRCKIDLSEHD